MKNLKLKGVQDMRLFKIPSQICSAFSRRGTDAIFLEINSFKESRWKGADICGGFS